MELRKLMLVCAVALSGLTLGCKSDCESVCSDDKACPHANSSTDCGKSCDDANGAASQVGCKSQLDDYWKCLSGLDDVCNADQVLTCNPQFTALSTCENKYCDSHQDDPECAMPGLP